MTRWRLLLAACALLLLATLVLEVVTLVQVNDLRRRERMTRYLVCAVADAVGVDAKPQPCLHVYP